MSENDVKSTLTSHTLDQLQAALTHTIEAHKSQRALNALGIPTQNLRQTVTQIVNAMTKIAPDYAAAVAKEVADTFAVTN